MSRVLIIAPHPDDEVLGVGGTISHHIARGDEVHVLIVTQGNPEVFDRESVERVREESRQAHAVLSVHTTHWGDFPAPDLDTVPHYRLVAFIRQVLEEVQPAIIYLPHNGDVHLDHRYVYQATLAASRPASGLSVHRLLCYETLSETEWAPPMRSEVFAPTVFVNISAHLETKQQAMSCYRSQLRSYPHPRSLECIKALAQIRGATVGLPAAEAFMLVREIIG